MSMRFTEHPHNTPEQVREYLREALAIVEELDVPEDMREAALTKAVDLVSAKQIIGEQVAPLGGRLAIPGSL